MDVDQLEQFVENRRGRDDLPKPIVFKLPEFTPEELEASQERERQQVELERRRDIAKRVHDFTHSLPSEYRECRLRNYRIDEKDDYQRQAVKELSKAAEAIVSGDVLNVVLFGPVGTGKDHLAVSIAGSVVQSHESWTGVFLPVQSWFSRIRDAMNTDTSERELLNAADNRGILILSDPTPPVGSLTQHQATMLYNLAERRSSAGLPTITTINVEGSAEADAKIGAATFDRLKNRAIVVECRWKSYRQPIKTLTRKRVKP